ncbi:MAG: hypothetical protein RIE24_07420 [Silicimonas sp.]
MLSDLLEMLRDVLSGRGNASTALATRMDEAGAGRPDDDADEEAHQGLKGLLQALFAQNGADGDQEALQLLTEDDAEGEGSEETEMSDGEGAGDDGSEETEESHGEGADDDGSEESEESQGEGAGDEESSSEEEQEMAFLDEDDGFCGSTGLPMIPVEDDTPSETEEEQEDMFELL